MLSRKRKMTEKKEVFEEQSLTLITTEGKEIVVNYKLIEDSDDYVLEDIREALKNNSIYYGEEWVDFEIKFGELSIAELDFKKIIGIRW